MLKYHKIQIEWYAMQELPLAAAFVPFLKELFDIEIVGPRNWKALVLIIHF